ncbi:MAG: hypothetical protein OXK76_07515 [Gammaproteobacteria bacterium]|nr:hypothetical protein [Gammaproteobacteria bacterium]
MSWPSDQTSVEETRGGIVLEPYLGQDQRYGQPVIDIARELNRYLLPIVDGARREGQNRHP